MTTDATQPTTALDRHLVEEVLGRYLRSADHRDPATMAALFTETADLRIYYSGAGEHELIAQLTGASAIGSAVASGLSPHPKLGWSHHTTLNPIVTITGDEGTFDAQFLVYNVRGLERPAGGWPDGASGAQGTILPIESGYVFSRLVRTDRGWLIDEHVIKHDLPYAFPGA